MCSAARNQKEQQKMLSFVLSFSGPVVHDDGESLKFNSQFECGNLRKAVQVRK